MTRLYTKEKADQLRRKADQARTAAWLTAASALTACIVMCCLVRTANAGALQITVISVSVLAGWAVILLTALVTRPARAEAEHMLGLLADTPQEHEGILTLKPDWVSIPKSITVRKVSLEENGSTLSLNLNSRMVSALPENGSRVRLLTVRSYIIAIEVCS